MTETPEQQPKTASAGSPDQSSVTGSGILGDEEEKGPGSPAAAEATIVPAAEALYIVRESSTLEEFDERLEAKGIKLKEGHGG